MISWPVAQSRLGVKADNNPGPVTYAALMGKVAGRPISTTISGPFATHLPIYSVDDNPNRLAAWIAQTCYESGGYHYTREIWGPTAAQRGYDKRADLGNICIGDGYKYRGGGWIEVTGRHWFDVIGNKLGIDLINHPELSNEPETATLMSLEWWRMNAMNVVADLGDTLAVTRKVNGGTNGLSERIAMTDLAKEILT